MKTQIKRRPFGNTGISVSELSLGAMNLRLTSTRQEAEKTVDAVLDQGVNLIDTAFAYTGVNPAGEAIESEDVVGTVIERRTDIDEPIVIITKNHGYTPEVFDEELDVSLRRLRVRQQDGKLMIGQTEIKLVVFFHGIKQDRWESMVQTNAIAHAKSRQAEGKFTYLGFSAHYGDGEQIKAAIDTGAFQVVELPYNVYNRAIGEDGEINLQKYAVEHGLAVVNMKTFNGNGMVASAKIIKDVCDIGYADMLRFVLSNPYVTTADVGAKYDYEFLADVEAALQPPMQQAERNELKARADRVAGYFSHICRECMHCMEKFKCPQGVNFPEILGLYARYKMSSALGKDTSEFKVQYQALSGEKAQACIACGACNAWCEYHLDIPQQLEEVRAVWG